MDFSDDEDYIAAALEIIESKKALSRDIHCLACGEQMKIRKNSIRICAECLSEECESYEELSQD